MSRGKNFIEREVFDELMREIQRLDGGEYEDLDTAYGDMSRLVVAWLAGMTPDQLADMYNELGWKGSANVRQMHSAARRWLEKYHPNLIPVVKESTA